MALQILAFLESEPFVSIPAQAALIYSDRDLRDFPLQTQKSFVIVINFTENGTNNLLKITDVMVRRLGNTPVLNNSSPF